MSADVLAGRIAADQPWLRIWLRELVAVASVSVPTPTGLDLDRSAADVDSLLRDSDLDAVDVVEAGARGP